MKSILEFLVNKPVTTDNKLDPTKFIENIEKILSKYAKIIDEKQYSVDDKLFITKRELSAKYENNINADTYIEYSMRYSLTNKPTIRDDSFYLTLNVWFDNDLNRYRYIFTTFGLLLPGTNKGGYNSPYNTHFPSIKVIDKFYNEAINIITNMFKSFVNNTSNMQKMYDKCRSKYKNPTNAEFIKIFKQTYPDIA